jgi:transcriptional regulator with XRE-family HTH domain
MEQNVDLLLGQRLKFFRLKKNWNQQSVAKLIGMTSQQTYSKLENGETHFTDEIIEKISKTFSIEPAEFVKPIEAIHISNSPHANNNSPNSTLNEIQFVKELIRAKDETIESLRLLLEEKDNLITLLRNNK